LRELKQVVEENTGPKRLVAELSLDTEAAIALALATIALMWPSVTPPGWII
jgi:hypothetical protein